MSSTPPGPKPVTLEIDGRSVTVDNGATVMDAATKLGIFVPHFCYHKKLTIAANCRMCLVQVEKAPKPLPACATPATEGMKAFTHSTPAINAQKGVMEFLLINHPLDCPICDQGGECQLQDLAVGYGASASRYQEEKRVVVNKNLGPLISTDMTRCIHCTRCVRFGQEIAGIMELGMAGRGEHSEILSFVGRSVDSEVSGNMIDLCPVGALTSKPFRYTARAWELSRRKSVSPHDSLGSTLVIQSKQERVMRVLPLESDDVNECWISDRDRFAYEGINSEERLLYPMVKRAGQWAEVDWPEALEAAAQGLKDAVAHHGADQLGALLAPHLTLEELHLATGIARGLGSDNIDHRIHQSDFRARTRGAPWLGMSIQQLAGLEAVLLVGSTLRKEQPLLAARLRGAAKRGLQVSVLHVADDELLMPVAQRSIVRPDALAAELGRAGDGIGGGLKGRRSAIVLGHYAQQRPDFSALLAHAHDLARATGATVCVLPQGANAVGAHLVGAVPTRGLDAAAMIARPRKAWLVAGLEAELDIGPAALAALQSAEFAIALSAYRNATTEAAHVMLPIGTFAETGGTFVNMEGRVQSFNAAVKPQGQARPGWKVLRMLGAMLDLPGFHAETLQEIRQAIAPDLQAWATQGLDNALAHVTAGAGDSRQQPGAQSLQRIAEIGLYAGDPIVRRSRPLQKTADGRASRSVRVNPATAAALGLAAGDVVKVAQGGEAELPVVLDPATPEGCVRIARGVPETAALASGEVTLTKLRESAAA